MSLTYDDLAPLDWPQLKCLLWEQAPSIDRRNPGWEAIAERVNGKCVASTPQDATAYEAAFNAMVRAMPEVFSKDLAAGAGQRAWLEMLYVRAQRLFGRPRFMNLGYAGDPDPNLPIELPEAYEPSRFAIQLYHQLIDGADLLGGSVLEVGCGGCGGLDHIARRFDPELVVGLDVVSETLSHARRAGGPGTRRLGVARAEDLPFRDGAFDAVVSVESSEHYHDIDRFMREARRVLKPGGALYLADLRWNGRHDGDWGASRSVGFFRRQLEGAGFRIARFDDISGNVLRSIEIQDEGKRQAIDYCGLTASDAKQFREVMLCVGSRNHELMARGDIRYFSTVGVSGEA